MAEWTTTYRWEGTKENDAQGNINHDVRAPWVQPTNPEVNPTRTALNVTRVFDGRGGLRDVRPDEDVAHMIKAELDRVVEAAPPNMKRHQKRAWSEKHGKVMGTGEYEDRPVALGVNASVMTRFIVQLDGEFTGTGVQLDPDEDGMPLWMMDENGDPLRDERGDRVPVIRTVADMGPEQLEEAKRLLWVMAEEMVQQHPTSQWLYVSLHLDETHPHIQAAMVPTTADGRVNQKEVLGAGKMGKGGLAVARAKYSGRHDEMREKLRSEGYEATFDRVSGPKSLGLHDYKQMRADDARRWSKIADEREKLAAQEKKLTATLSIAKKDGAAAWDLKKTAKKGLADAEEQAATITATAQQEATAITAEAEEIHRSAHSRGYQSGYQAGREAAEALTTTAVADADAARAAREAAEELRKKAEEDAQAAAEALAQARATPKRFESFLDQQGLRPAWRDYERKMDARRAGAAAVLVDDSIPTTGAALRGTEGAKTLAKRAPATVGTNVAKDRPKD